MKPTERATLYAEACPDFPPLRADDRWVDGVWLLGNNYKGSGYYGAYPPGYLPRILPMFPEAQRVMHLFSGSLPAHDCGQKQLPRAAFVTVDRKRDHAEFGDVRPTVQAEIATLTETHPDLIDQFDLILADPPYSGEDAERYGTCLVSRKDALEQARKCLRSGGNLVWMDQVLPMHRKSEWHWWGAIALVRSTNHRVRLVSIFEKKVKP